MANGRLEASEKDRIATGIAAALDGWAAEPATGERAQYNTRDLVDAEGRRIALWFGEYSNAPRLEIRPDWPRTASGEWVGPPYDRRHINHNITVDQGKDPAKIAGDIRRRFLPTFLETWKAVQERVESSNDHVRKTEATAKALEAIGGRRSKGMGTPESIPVNFYKSHAGSVYAQGESVRFEFFSCPAAVALRVLEALKKGGDE